MSIKYYPEVILGTIATQNANAVAITGGSIAGLSSLLVAASTPTFGAREEIVYGSMAAIGFRPTTDASPIACYFTNAAGTGVGSIVTTATATAYGTSSDVRLKEAVIAIAGALSIINTLRPVQFRWQSNSSTGYGFLAHELQQIIPEAVTGEPDAINNDGSIRPQQVDHSKLIPWLVGAVQELAARVEYLETQLGV